MDPYNFRLRFLDLLARRFELLLHRGDRGFRRIHLVTTGRDRRRGDRFLCVCESLLRLCQLRRARLQRLIHFRNFGRSSGELGLRLRELRHLGLHAIDTCLRCRGSSLRIGPLPRCCGSLDCARSFLSRGKSLLPGRDLRLRCVQRL